MRRIITFLVFMNFLLFSGGQYLCASVHQKSHLHNYDHKHRVRYTTHEQGSSIIEEADLDLDEDFQGGGALKDNFANKNFTANYSLLDNWYLTFSDQIQRNCHRHFKFFVPFTGNSNPIYITQRVLRI